MKNANEKQAKAVQTVVLNDSRFAVEERNGNISFNMTMMSKTFGKGKRPTDWLKTEESERYLKALTVTGKIVTAQNQPVIKLVEVRQGGTPELQGTWANDYRIAMRYAQWLDMDLAIAVDELIYKILTKQVITIEPKRGVIPVYVDGKRWYCFVDALRALGGSTRSSASSRKRRSPNDFTMIYGRNFISEYYFDLLAGYYDWKSGVAAIANNQLSIDFGGQSNG